ncbi:UNVERIFIED_CONTAM: hypothetical protein DES50_11468 [Williamsia faeni]
MRTMAVTPFGSPQMTDGASAVLLSTDEGAAQQKLPVLAHLFDVS